MCNIICIHAVYGITYIHAIYNITCIQNLTFLYVIYIVHLSFLKPNQEENKAKLRGK